MPVYYDLKEKEIRQLERIEEQFMRKVLNTWKEETIESNLHLQESQTHTQFFVCEHQTKGLKELKKTDNGTWHLSIFTPCLLQLLPKIEGACLLRFPR